MSSSPDLAVIRISDGNLGRHLENSFEGVPLWHPPTGQF